MKLELKRLHDDGETTLGALYLDGIFNCFIVEDQEQTVKVWGETRIPCGTFQVSLRKEGGIHNKYKMRYGQHDGMLCVHNSKNWKIKENGMTFQYILIHIGNTDKHTAGCLLPNETVNSSNMRGSGSLNAYKRLYPIVRKAILDGDSVSIEITDIEPGK